MNTDLTMNSELIDTGLTIDLPLTRIEMIRGEKFYGPTRERVTGEKYFRQAIQVYNKEGKLVDSGFVQINDYTDMCRMVRVCNKSKKTFHLFERWEHYGKDFYKTSEFTITDLARGITVGTVVDSYISNFVKNTKTVLNDCCCLVGDLEKDEYSTILLECLNEYSDLNRPPINQDFKKIFSEEAEAEECYDCNLLQHLEIDDLFRNGEINKERRDVLLNSLVCKCQNKPLEPELTEEQQSKRSELKLKAQAEISEVFTKKDM
jgi:hypothetical protein